MFSTNQQKFLNRQRESGQGINAAFSGMTCIDHAKKSIVEFRCQRCDLIKPADEYSKNSRKNEVYVSFRLDGYVLSNSPRNASDASHGLKPRNQMLPRQLSNMDIIFPRKKQRLGNETFPTAATSLTTMQCHE